MRLCCLLPVAFLSCLSLAACSKAESHDASTPADSVIGIVQCDDYLARANACLRGHVPAERRTALAAELRDTFTTWKDAAAHPEHRATLPQACSVTHEVAREELARYGCAL